MDENMEKLREAQFQRGCDRYADKLAAGRGGLRRDGNAEAQVRNYVSGNLVLQRLRSDTAKVLDAVGVSSIVRPYYYGFALALGRRSRELWSTEQLLREGRALLSVWEARGLERAALLSIAKEVLSLDLTDTESQACARRESDI